MTIAITLDELIIQSLEHSTEELELELAAVIMGERPTYHSWTYYQGIRAKIYRFPNGTLQMLYPLMDEYDIVGYSWLDEETYTRG